MRNIALRLIFGVSYIVRLALYTVKAMAFLKSFEKGHTRYNSGQLQATSQSNGLFINGYQPLSIPVLVKCVEILFRTSSYTLGIDRAAISLTST